MGRRAVQLLFGLASVVMSRDARADSTIDLDGMVDDAGADHVRVPFEVPSGTAEIEIIHDDLSDEDILDFGLDDPTGFRGWGGGNKEPIVVAEAAASRSYLTGPIEPGTWYLVIGKAKLDGGEASYHATVSFRDVQTLAPQPERSPFEAPDAIDETERWYAGDFHVHSRESGDADATLLEIATLAQERGLDFVEITDHNTTSTLDFLNAAHADVPGFLFLPGVEFTTYGGHANGIGATAFVDHKLGLDGMTIERAMDAFEDQDALFAINHPAFALGDACIGCAWEHSVGDREVHAVELVTAGSASVFLDQTLVFYEALAANGQRPAAIGGSDDHRAGVNPGAFGTPIGSPTTMVYARDLSVEEIMTGVRLGRTVVKVRGPEDPMVDLQVIGARAVAHVTDGQGMLVRFVVDGEPREFIAMEAADSTLEVTDLEPGEHRVRVEVWDETAIATLTSFVFFEVEMHLPATLEPTDVRGGGGCGVSQAAAPPTFASALLLGVLIRCRRRRKQKESYGTESTL